MFFRIIDMFYYLIYTQASFEIAHSPTVGCSKLYHKYIYITHYLNIDIVHLTVLNSSYILTACQIYKFSNKMNWFFLLVIQRLEYIYKQLKNG